MLKQYKVSLHPEFRNRIDAVIKFNKLSTEVIQKIVKRLEDEINEQLKDKNIVINLDQDTVDYFVENGYESQWVPRSLKRLFEGDPKKSLSKKILFEDLRNVQ